MTVYLPNRFLALSLGPPIEQSVSKLVADVTNSSSPVSVEKLTGGITNQLILAEQDGLKMLVRSFGKGTDSFIDRDREFAVHQCLQTLGLAPKLYCRFGNGLIYGYVPGRPTSADELGDEYIMRQVSHRLAQWHAKLKPEDVARSLSHKKLGDFWQVLELWVELCPDGVLPLSQAELKQQFDFLRSNIYDRGGDCVMGHCDLLGANILVPHEIPRKASPQNSVNEDAFLRPESPYESTGGLSPTPIDTEPNLQDSIASDAAFIDYEYAIPCPRAFDISNHFQEWQGYECLKSRVPRPDASSKKLVYWCEHYLHTFTSLTDKKQNLEDLIAELQAWWGMPGFYWGVWSAIQSKSSDIDFDYHAYASNRFQEYLNWRMTWIQASS